MRVTANHAGAGRAAVWAGPERQSRSIPTYNLAWGLRTVDGQLQPSAARSGAVGGGRPGVSRASDDPQSSGLSWSILTAPGRLQPFRSPTRPAMMSTDPVPLPIRATSSTPRFATISNLIVDQTLGNPAAILTALQRAGVDDPGHAHHRSDFGAYAPLKPLFKDCCGAAQRAEASAAAAAAAQAQATQRSRPAAADCSCRPSLRRRARWTPPPDVPGGLHAICSLLTASSLTAPTSTSPTSRRTKACRLRSTRGSRCSASSSITASTSSTRAATAR